MATTWRKLSISVGSLLVFMLLLEAGLRVAGFRYKQTRAPMTVWNRAEDVGLRNADYVFERSTRQLWAPRAGASDTWDEGEVINEDGYRGPALPLEKRPGVLRIATLGDSSTFGMGVRYRETYSARLVDELAKLGIEAETLNGGVVGFTIRQGIERYDELIRRYDPDIVTLAFGAVNEHVPAQGPPDVEKIARHVQNRSSGGKLSRTLRRNVRILHLISYLAEEARGGKGAIRRVQALAERDRHELNKVYGARDWSGVRRVSPADFGVCLASMKERLDADGAKMLLISMPRHEKKEKSSPVLLDYNEIVREFAKAQDTMLFSARGVVRKQLKAGVPWEELFVDSFHPSPAGHALLASRLAAVIARDLE